MMLRFPRPVLEVRTAKSYCRGKAATATAKGDFVILSFDSEDESGDGWDDDGTGWLSSLIPLRADIAAGDYRALYLAWLLCVQEGEIPPHAAEPLIPPGLGKLTAPLRAFADFMRIDPDLLAVASERSAEPASRERLGRWVTALPADAKSDLLVRVASGDSQGARAELLRRFRDGRNAAAGAKPRTVAQLLAAAKLQAAERQSASAGRPSEPLQNGPGGNAPRQLPERGIW